MTTGEQLEFDGTKVVLRETTVDDPTGNEIVVRAEWSQVSIGTESASIRMAQAHGETVRLGYSLVGKIEKAGPDATTGEGQRILGLLPHASVVKTRDIPAAILPVPDGLAPDLATVGILGSVAFHIVERAGVRTTESVAVFGQGMVGSLALQLAKRSGAVPVIAVDVDEHKLDIAKEYGADHCLNPDTVNVQDAVVELTDGKLLNVVIEATGKAGPVRSATDALGLGGRLVLASYTFEPVSFSVQGDIIGKELTIIGAHQPKCPVEPTAYYPFSQVRNRAVTMAWLKQGILKADKLISHRVPSRDAPALYARMLTGDKELTGAFIDWR